ncbi:MAG: 3'-5' exonuclease [Faecalibacterium sp.]
MPKQNLIVFDLEWNIGYQPYRFNYYGVEQTLRGEIVAVGAVKIDENCNIIDTFEGHFRPRIFRRLQHHIAKVTGLTQKDLDQGEPIAQGLRRFIAWCGEDAVFAEWGLDDVPVLKQNLFLLNLDESYPTTWYDLQRVFEAQRPRGEGEGMTLESVVTRLGIPMERPFHDALSDTLYTVDICREIDLQQGIAVYPDAETLLKEGLCMGDGVYRDVKVFRGYLDRDAYRNQTEIRDVPCPVCGQLLAPDEIWQKRGNNGYYTLCSCAHCAGGENEAKDGLFLRYRLARPDGLRWMIGRCLEIPTEQTLALWQKKRKQTLDRMQKLREKAQEG